MAVKHGVADPRLDYKVDIALTSPALFSLEMLLYLTFWPMILGT